MKNFCSSTGIIQKSEKATYKVGENTCKSFFSDKGLVYKVYKNSQNSTLKDKQPNYKMSQDLNRYFSKEYVQTSNKYMKRYSAPQSLGKRKSKL